jgi:hypothetical protein
LSQGYIGSGKLLLKAIKKYGKENFERQIIEKCNSKNELNEREKYWISFYKTNDRNIGYNISLGGNGGNLGEKVNKLISEKNKGYILARDKDGKSLKVKANDERFITGEIVAFQKGKKPHNKGKPMSKEQKEKLKKPKTEEHKKKLKAKREKNTNNGVFTKHIICVNSGKEYLSIKSACNELGLFSSNVVNVLKGKSKSIKGYKFIYK